MEVDLDALRRNYEALRTRVGGATLLLPMLKADGYGLGAVRVARALSGLEPWALGVATVDEARELRDAGSNDRLVVFSPCPPVDADEIVRLGVEPAVSSLEALRSFHEAADGDAGPLPVHLEVDTGMGRLGLLASEAGEWIPEAAALLEDGAVEVASTFTHFHSAASDPTATRRQAERFEEVLRAMRAAGLAPGPTHLANSAAILRHPELEADVARPGLYLYGGLGAEPVASVRARVLDVRELPADHPVSYGALYRTEARARIGTLGIGYGDGLRHDLSERGHVIVHGRRAPVRGAVCMDVTAVDVTEIDEARPGSVATVLGSDGERSVTLEEMADASGTIPYEILTGLGRRLPRIYRGGATSADGGRRGG